MNNWSPSESAHRSIIASAGWTPRRRPSSATVGLGGSPCSVDPDALEVGRPRLGAEALPLPVVGGDGGVDVGLAQLGVAQHAHLFGDGARPQFPPRIDQVEGEPRLEREQHRNAPAVRLGYGATAGRGHVVEEVEEVARLPGGHQTEGERHAGLGGQHLETVQGAGPDCGVGGQHAAIDPFEDAAPERSHDPDERHHLLPGGQAGRHRAVVRRLVMLDPRGGEADGAGRRGRPTAGPP